MEPSTHRSYGPHGGPSGGQLFFSHAMERLRILGEIPLRKFDGGGNPILDAEGHPDTSFLLKVPANTPFTFQTLDRNGMVLNMAQTWHQLRPGEIRNNCGGCHAHSQKPTLFKDTAAAKPDWAAVLALSGTHLHLYGKGEARAVAPTEEKFSGFVFKIQANMDPKHRDRIAFLRVCSGRFERGMKIRVGRTGKDIAARRRSDKASVQSGNQRLDFAILAQHAIGQRKACQHRSIRRGGRQVDGGHSGVHGRTFHQQFSRQPIEPRHDVESGSQCDQR